MHKQQGMSLLGILLIIITAGFYILLMMKIAPLYMDYYSIKSILSNIQSQPAITTRDDFNVAAKTFIEKNLRLNNVNVISADDVKIIPQPNGAKLEVSYEGRANIINDIDVVVKFNTATKVHYSGEK